MSKSFIQNILSRNALILVVLNVGTELSILIAVFFFLILAVRNESYYSRNELHLSFEFQNHHFSNLYVLVGVWVVGSIEQLHYSDFLSLHLRKVFDVDVDRSVVDLLRLEFKEVWKLLFVNKHDRNQIYASFVSFDFSFAFKSYYCKVRPLLIQVIYYLFNLALLICQVHVSSINIILLLVIYKLAILHFLVENIKTEFDSMLPFERFYKEIEFYELKGVG